jgi:PAS domain S-box-containing protein
MRLLRRLPVEPQSDSEARHEVGDGTHAALVEFTQEGLSQRPSEVTAQQYADWDRSFVAVVKSAINPVITMTLDGTITTWNPAAERLYGYSAAEAVGASIDIIIPADRRTEHQAVLDIVSAGHPGENFESSRISKNGRLIDVLVVVSALRSPAGETVGFVSITRDISEHKAAEEKFRLAVESCPNGMKMSDAAGTIVMVNGEVERLFGYEREELIGRSIDVLVPDRLRRQHVRHRETFTREAMPHRSMAGRELVGLCKDGSEFPAEVGLNPIRTAEGLMVLSAIVDISERKRLDRLKDKFVSVVSHELRTPMTSISGALGLLMGNAAGDLPDKAMRLLTIAHANSERLVRLINDILDLQKIEAGQVVFHLQYLRRRTLIEQTIDANRAFAQGFDVRMRLDEESVDGEVFADCDRLAQILTNLLSNAIKYSPAGDEVVVGIERRGADIRVTVRDHGGGIPDEFKPRIFHRFAQADSSDARQKGGTGLGLSIVKQLIDQHGGKVGFEPAPGGGTVFFFDLPCSSGAADSDQAPHVKPNGPPVLLCNDDAASAALLAAALLHAGLAVEAVSTGTGACASAAETTYAALVIDLQLPDLDGISLIRRLRALPRHTDTPIIAVAIDQSRTRGPLRPTALPVNDLLDKPNDRTELVRVITRAIAGTAIPRPRVLHFEGDEDLRQFVHETLRGHADIVSAGTIDGARTALAALEFDLVVLDLTRLDEGGLDVLTQLHDSAGHGIPALLFSAAADAELARRVNAVLARSRMSIDAIVGTVRLAIARHIGRGHARIEVA